MDKRFDRLPELMKAAIRTLKELHNTPDSLAMPAILGVANSAAMPHYQIDSILFGVKPISLFIVCMLPTGMRKTTVYNEVSVGLDRYQESRYPFIAGDASRYELEKKLFGNSQKKYIKEIEEHGVASMPVPIPPAPAETCNYTISKGTLNGIIDQLKSQPWVGLSSSEAGEFFNGHAFQGGRDNSKAIELSASLTNMWDGGRITKQTGMEQLLLSNRAVNMMFFLQEEVIRTFLNNPMYSEQGFVHRMLIAQSDYVDATEVDLTSEGLLRLEAVRNGLESFHHRIQKLISQPLQLKPDRNYELDPATLRMDAGACRVFQDFLNIDQHQGNFVLKDWAGFSIRLGEHLLRIAGTLAAFELSAAVTRDHMLAARDLMDFFAEQRRQLQLGVSTRDPQGLLAADRLLGWIRENNYSGTANDIRLRLKWFGKLTKTERDELLTELVSAGELQMATSVASNNKTISIFSLV